MMEITRENGAWLSLVERCVRDAEVAGSNPVAPIHLSPVEPLAGQCIVKQVPDRDPTHVKAIRHLLHREP